MDNVQKHNNFKSHYAFKKKTHLLRKPKVHFRVPKSLLVVLVMI
jgi:hypothetical protein